MPVYVRDMPFYKKKRQLDVLGTDVIIYGGEPIVWITVTAPDEDEVPASDAVRFPALVDTGHTHTLRIWESHLTSWTNPTLKTEELPAGKKLKTKLPGREEETSFSRLAKVWLHPYPDSSELLPLDLKVEEYGGIVVVTNSPNAADPHVPILGAKAFFGNGLKINFDYKRTTVSIES